MAKDDDRVEAAIQEAGQLAAEMAALRARVADNRAGLRYLHKMHWLTPEQSAWLDDFYPVKTRADLDSQIANAEARAATLREKQAKKAAGNAQPVTA